jgi:hypothetical protein
MSGEQARGDLERRVSEGDAEALLQLGLRASADGDWEAAYTCWEHPGDRVSPDLAAEIAVVLESHGDAKRAREWFERGAEAGSAVCMVKLGICEQADGNVERARDRFEKVVDGGMVDWEEDFAAHDIARFRLAIIEARRGDVSHSLSLLGDFGAEDLFDEEDEYQSFVQSLQEHEVLDAAVCKRLAQIADRVGDLDSSAAYLRTAIGAGDTEAIFRLAETLEWQEYLGEPGESQRLRKSAWDRSSVCSACLEYVGGDACPMCGESDGLNDEAQLSDTELAVLWMNTEGQGARLVSSFLLDACDWDKVRDGELASVATWDGLMAYIASKGVPEQLLRDDRPLRNLSVDRRMVDEKLFWAADLLRGID